MDPTKSPRRVLLTLFCLAITFCAGFGDAAAQPRRLRAAAARPAPPPPSTAPVVTASASNARVNLSWTAVAGATRYKVFRSTTGVFDSTPFATVNRTTFRDSRLTNGTTYYYAVAGHNASGDGPLSAAVSATPMAPPAPPTSVAAASGNAMITISWTGSAGAAGYRVYRGTASNLQSPTAVASPSASPFVDTAVANSTTYYYKVTAFNSVGESARSAEVSASPEAPPPPPSLQTLAAFRLLRQATWGPKPGDVDRLKVDGVATFLSQQFTAPMSEYPDTLFDLSVESTQEHFMQLALTGPDQLRQRIAWALHKIWVVSAIDIDNAGAIVTYQRLLLNGAFGNYRDLMRNITLNPAMGRYLNMLNNRSQTVTGVPPNENYPRELMQLFTAGIPRLNADGSVQRNSSGQEIPVYTEADIKELARIFTGWTFGDGDPATIPTGRGSENYRVPMEAVARYHDIGAKTFLGVSFPANQTAVQDLDQALDVLFNHPNVGPFVSRQLIQQLVTYNPSGSYIAAVAAVFADNGAGMRGDLGAVVRAILTHPEAGVSSDYSGKLAEPVLFIVSQLRALDATVTDHPFMSDKADEMGQKVFYPGSVFSYFSPGYRVSRALGPTGAPLGGPEFQILTTVTSLVRANFVAYLLAGHFGDAVSFDDNPFTSRAGDPAALVDYCSELFMGTRMSTETRTEIIAAVRATDAGNTWERARTALYLTLVAAQSQVDW